MLEAADFITLPYTPDLNWAGIAYVCRMLAQPIWDARNPTYPQLRQVVAEKAATLALIRYLETRDVRFRIYNLAPFTDPNRSDIVIAGRRCEIRCSLSFQKTKTLTSAHTIGRLMKATALVPKDRIADENLGNEEIFIFSFVSALRNNALSGRSNNYEYMLYKMPESWNRPQNRVPLGLVRISNNSHKKVALEVAGYNNNHELQIEKLEIRPQECGVSGKIFDHLIYLHPDHVPDGAVTVYSTSRDKPLTILPHQWGNIWVYGVHIILCGSITISEVRRRIQGVSGSERKKPRTGLNQQHFRITIRELHPLDELFSEAKK